MRKMKTEETDDSIAFDMGDHYLYLTKHQVDILRKTFIREFLDKYKKKYVWTITLGTLYNELEGETQ